MQAYVVRSALVDAICYDHFYKAQIKVFPLVVEGTSTVAPRDHD